MSWKNPRREGGKERLSLTQGGGEAAVEVRAAGHFQMKKTPRAVKPGAFL